MRYAIGDVVSYHTERFRLLTMW